MDHNKLNVPSLEATGFTKSTLGVYKEYCDFQNEYPNITIHYVNASDEVESMIKRGLANK